MSLARRHFQRVTAAEASASAEDGAPINASAYELQLIKLYEDKRRLKDVQSIERKIEIKRQILPDYDPWVEGALDAGRGGQDDVLMTVMVWRIDTGDFAGALRIAEHALKHGLSLPDQYQRDVATLVAEEIADQSLKALSTGQSADAQALAFVAELTDKHDMPDEVRAKLFKAIGLEEQRSVSEYPAESPPVSFWQRALEFLRRAYQLNERIGVKKDIERLERQLKNTPAPAPAAEASPDPDSNTAQDAAAPPAAS